MAISSNKDAAGGVGVGRATQGPAVQWQPEKVTPFVREKGALALKRVSPAVEAEPAESLPLLASATDVREVVRLLKKRGGRLTVIEGMDAARRLFDPRKIAAYEYWGLVARNNDRLRLSALGWEFARQLEPEARLYRRMLDSTLAYRSALAWVLRQNLEIVTDAEVADHWRGARAEVQLSGNQKTIEGNVVCFFHLCQEAELGTATVGKRGQPTRLRVDRAELAAYIASDPSTPKNEEPPAQISPDNASPDNASTRPASDRYASAAPQAFSQRETQTLEQTINCARKKMRVFISCRKEAGVIKQLQAALDVAEIESEFCRRTSAHQGFMTEEMFGALLRSDAAVIVVTAEDWQTDGEGRPALDESLMMEIAAAVVHYNRRVLLLWDESLLLPARLCELPRCEFACDQLTWDSGVQLLKALKKFKS
jgi:hypothetical protein